MSAIEIKDYGIAYGEDGPAILSGCNMKIDYGELVLLSGLSGSGKSTLLTSINGIIPGAVSAVQTGDILVDGESILGKRISQISVKVGSVLQNAASQIVHAGWRMRWRSAVRTGTIRRRRSGSGLKMPAG